MYIVHVRGQPAKFNTWNTPILTIFWSTSNLMGPSLSLYNIHATFGVFPETMENLVVLQQMAVIRSGL